MVNQITLNILLADDDKDDRFFFEKALKVSSIPTHLITIEDGEKLLIYLSKNSDRLPDVLFLDFNMPRKNGSECLQEIKNNQKLKHLPVIIYSTYIHKDLADLLYKNGAHGFIRKVNHEELEKTLHHILSLLAEKKFVRPTRDQFTLNYPT